MEIKMDIKLLEDKLVEAIRKAATTVTQPTFNALKQAREREEGPAKVQIETMLKAIEIGRTEGIPICQDTGTITFFVEVGSSFPDMKDIGKIKPMLERVARRATKETPLRPNTVNPITHKNPGDNTGKHIPYVSWEIIDGDDLKITCLLKGGGSENMAHLVMMAPGRGLKGVKEVILDWIAQMAGKPCPPTIVGVGLGGGANIAMNLAKHAILRHTGEHHKEKQIADLEKELMKKANELGVGPMGVGGKTTVLDVKIEYAHRHPAGFPVGIIPQCWCDRKFSLRVKSDGSIEMIE
jgi:fumarate hydratase subunit alpha